MNLQSKILSLGTRVLQATNAGVRRPWYVVLHCQHRCGMCELIVMATTCTVAEEVGHGRFSNLGVVFTDMDGSPYSSTSQMHTLTPFVLGRMTKRY